MLHLDYKNSLNSGKNLLAFSGGVDSSALFFLLLENGIKFDIALVNYSIREQSKQEENYALALAKEYNLKAYITKSPKFNNNFEKNARDFRYNFFDEIIQKGNYTNLITAHQLNDQMEWLLMRLTKGAGVVELLGLEGITKRDNYTLIRPILQHSKNELLEYLRINNYKYFIDSSNSDIKYERNYFRKEFSDKLISEYRDGISRSFEYLKEDKKVLTTGYKEVFNYKQLYVIELINPTIKTRVIDIYLKRLGYLLSSAQREKLKKENSIVFGSIWAVEIIDNKIFIAPYIKDTMPKKYKEACRVAKIAPKIRAYCYINKIEPKMVLQS
ncbi:MAG: tRNA lysidine(34) synthetase TilS [Sulfurovaceae bacterium]|nr:tRNA lysidine(34) synthetase TilS [Sulfurovaceae bacterium]